MITGHALAALAALALGSAQLAMPKGGIQHYIVGYAWVVLMACVSVSSFWIHDLRVIGPFSPIHFLSIFTLGTLAYAIRAARRGEIAAHQSAMRWLFFAALIGAGAFTLLPGRVMYQVLLGQ